MKVENRGGITSNTSVKGAGASAAPGFSVPSEGTERPAAASGMGPTGAITSLGGILALQGADDAAQRRARQARRGRVALDTLERLERALVMGSLPAGLKADIEHARTGSESTGDAGLDDVLLEIDIRLAVEAAKLERIMGAGGGI